MQCMCYVERLKKQNEMGVFQRKSYANICKLYNLFHQDYFTNGYNASTLDSQQDWVLINSSEQDGVTTLKFYRKRNTIDEHDVIIEVS